MDHGLAAGGGSYCPAFVMLADADDDALAAASGRAVTDGCPEPRADETRPQWFAVTAMAGVATDDEGRPAHGADSQVVNLGKGEGVLLVTDQRVTCLLTTGELLGDAAALVLSFELDEVRAVDADRTGLLRKRARSLTIELAGASWGAMGVAVAGELAREPGTRDAQLHPADAEPLAHRLSAP
jgi:hypothetical protein